MQDASEWIMAQRIKWVFQAGLQPSLLALDLPNEVAERFMKGQDGKAVLPPEREVEIQILQDMHGQGMQGVGPPPIRLDFTLKRLLILQASATRSPWETRFLLADMRALLQGVRVSGTYNLRRESSDAKIIAFNPDGTRANDVVGLRKTAVSTGWTSSTLLKVELPAVKKLFAIAQRVYVPWTIRNDKDPYTAKFLALHLVKAAKDAAARNVAVTPRLTVFLRQLWMAISQVPDNGFIEADVIIREELFVAALQRWLIKAEIGVSLNSDGEWYAWRLDDQRPFEKVLENLPPTIEAGGYWNVISKGRMRAAVVTTSFLKWYEMYFRAVHESEWTAAKHEKKPMAIVQNVLTNPDDIEWKGKVYRKGAPIPTHIALAAWNAELPDNTMWPAPAAPSPKTLTAQIVRNWWLPVGLLEERYGRIIKVHPVNGKNIFDHPVWGRRMAALRHGYRQQWQIQPLFMQFILDWRMERAEIVDPVNRTPIGPYISVDHCEIPDINMPEMSGLRGVGGTNIKGNANPTKAQGMPATLTVVDQATGIFRVDFPLSDFYTGRYNMLSIPSLITDATMPPLALWDVTSSNPNKREWKTWEGATLSKDFQGHFIFMAQFGSNPDPAIGESAQRSGGTQQDALYHPISISAAGIGEKGETNKDMIVQRFSGADVARMPLDNDLLPKDVPANAIQLNALASSKAREYYVGLHDRLEGTFSVPGWHPVYENLFGQIGGIAFQIDEGGEVTTTFDLTPDPRVYSDPGLQATMPPKIHGMLPRGKGGNK